MRQVALYELILYQSETRVLYRSANTLPEIHREAGKLAKQNDCAVDVAFHGDKPWHERYLITANPCCFTDKGYYLERLDG